MLTVHDVGLGLVGCGCLFWLVVCLEFILRVWFLRVKRAVGQKVNIFLDYSNISIGANAYGRVVDFAKIRDFMVNESVQSRRNVFFFPCPALSLTEARVVDDIFLAGSGHEWLEQWDAARDAGFTCKVMKRVDRKEQGVDESVHYAMSRACRRSVRRMSTLRAFFACRRCYARDVLLLATGDGNENDGISSFVSECEEAIVDGLDVEIYAFEKSISAKYFELRRKHGKSRCEIFFLDAAIDRITATGQQKTLSGRKSNSSRSRLRSRSRRKTKT